MAVTVTDLRITDDHTSRTAAEVLSNLQLDQGSPDAKQKCDMLLRDLDFPNGHQNEGDYSQFVCNGQCLVLGDSRAGKTSLVNSLTKKPFDSEEPSTLGVHRNSVDREWQKTSLAFGGFARFGKSVRSVRALISSEGYVAFENVTSKLSSCFIWSLYLFFSVLIWELTNPFILLIVLQITLLPGIPPPCPLHFAIGLMFAHLAGGVFRGINCCCTGLPCIRPKHLDLLYYEFIVTILRLVYLSPLTGKCIDYFLEPLEKKWLRSRIQRRRGDIIKSSLPGQVKIYNYRQVFSPELNFYAIGSLINGIGLGFSAELLIDMSILSYCEILHYTTMLCFGLSVLWFMRSLCKGSHFMEGIVSPILSICIFENTRYGWRSSFSMFLYVAMLAGCACCARIFHTNSESNFVTRSYNDILVQKVTLNYLELRKALNAKFSSLTLGILDFGGDYKKHFAYHHLFYKSQAMYVVVFNLAHFTAGNFQNINANIQRICFWLESIRGRVAPKIPIFLVGTHRGNISKACLGHLNKRLHQSLWQTFSDDLMMNEEDKLMYFPVENKNGIHDKGIKNLQRKIIHIAEEYQTTLGHTIPFSWIKIQDAIINLWENCKAKFCVSLEHFPTSFSDFICSNWSKETLKYFHEKGLVIYIDKGENSVISKWVLLKPSLLVDITIQLITPTTDDELFSQHGFGCEWTLLHNKGMLTNSLLSHILTRFQENEEAMTGFLEEYGIICPLFYMVDNDMTEATVTHFVPALLPVSVEGNTSVWIDHPTDKRLYVFFERFLPEALFHRLLSRAHQLSEKSFFKGQPLISRNIGRFWLTPTQSYRLLYLKEEDIIEVTFSYRCDTENLHPSIVLSQVFGMVKWLCWGHFPHVKFHCGPACPSEKCPGHQRDYISHPGVQKSIFRRHVTHVLPKENSSFYCANQNFADDLKEWQEQGGLTGVQPVCVHSACVTPL